ncbi:MAG TPA: hypothetical protein VFV68_11420 [Agriterribacter sp.]|nr:hypothetical protein [Agriterribacter sp.]
MKRLLLLVPASLIFLSSFAQSNKEDIDMIQAMYGKQKKEIAADFIMVPDAKKDAFWKMYDDYETERKTLGKQRISLLEKYANAYDTLGDRSTDAIIKQTMTQQKGTDALIGKYYDKIMKSVGVKPAAQFYQLESYLLNVVRAYIMNNIPFIGELEKTAAPAQH